MDPTPRTPPPSAMDGFRRLEKARSGERAATATTLHERVNSADRGSTSRVAGALRLIGFLAVIMVIVATSVGLAIADSSDESSTRAATATKPSPAQTVTKKAVASKPAPAKAAAPKVATAKLVPATKIPTTSPVKTNVTPSSSVTPSPSVAARTSTKTVSDAATTAPLRQVNDVAVTSTTAAAQPSAEQLPMTGDASVQHVLLAGAVLVLIGMLVQIAGQPLPAHVVARR